MAEELKPIEDMTFREIMDEVNTIATKLESNTIELEESLAFYRRGVALLGAASARLNQAEQDVVMLKGELSGATDDTERDTTLS